MEATPAGRNHVKHYYIEDQPHDYDLRCACFECYARTQRLIRTYWSAESTIQTYILWRLSKYQEFEDATEQAFNPEQVLARYCELETLLTVEMLTRPDWQAQRAQGNYEWLRTNTHFIERETLLKLVAQNGLYTC